MKCHVTEERSQNRETEGQDPASAWATEKHLQFEKPKGV